MKRLLLILMAALALSCQKKAPYANPIPRVTEIEHYHFHEENANDPDFWHDKGGTAFSHIIFRNEFLDLKNDSIKNSLDKYFKSKTLSASETQKVKKLFHFKFLRVQESSFASFVCAPVYRDILVFKQADKTVGIAKVCFGCNHNFVMVANNAYENIDIDYETLRSDLGIPSAADRRK